MFIWYIEGRFKSHLNLYLINSHTHTHTCMKTQKSFIYKEKPNAIDNYIYEDTNTINVAVMIFEELKYISV